MTPKKPKYIVESKSDGKHYFKTKKEICETYGIGLDDCKSCFDRISSLLRWRNYNLDLLFHL